MPREAGEDALQKTVRLARLDGAAALVREGDHAIDAGKILLEFRAFEAVRHVMRNRRRAIHAGDHGEVVARADPPARAEIPLEGTHLFGREILHLQIVRVHVLARRDKPFGKTDDLAVFSHRLAISDSCQGNLVAGRNGFGDRQADRSVHQLRVRLERAFDYGHVVILPQAERNIFKFLLDHVSRVFPSSAPKDAPIRMAKWS